MPRRTNLFQEVIEILQSHMDPNSVVEPSAMLTGKKTGKLREVDVVIRAKVGGYDVIVSIEAVGRSRKATREWVEQMAAKHDDLPTNRLVLVSEKGFTADARKAALAYNAIPLSTEDATGGQLGGKIVNVAASLFPKVVSFNLKGIGLDFVKNFPAVEHRGVNLVIKNRAGETLFETQEQLFHSLYNANIRALMSDPMVTSASEDVVNETAVSFDIADMPELIDGLWVEHPSDGKLYRIRKVTGYGTNSIEAGEVPLVHKQFSETSQMYSFGVGKLGDQEALIVATENEQGGRVSFRVRPRKP